MTVINLSKGQGISLSKEAPGLSRLRVGLGWDERATNGQAFDLDASALLLGADNRIRNEKDFVFYNNLSTPNGSVVHQGDNRTGNGDGDDETIIIELDQVDPEIQRIVIIASSHSGDGATPINFGQVQNAYINTYDAKDTTLDALVEDLMGGAEAFKGSDPIDSYCGLFDARL